MSAIALAVAACAASHGEPTATHSAQTPAIATPNTSHAQQPTAGAEASPQGSSKDEARPSLRHAVQAAHLREMMAELDYLASTRLPEDTDSASKGRPSERGEILEDIGDTAEALAGTAADIPSVLEEVRMSAQDKTHFRELANRLRSQAQDLRVRAAHGEIEDVNETLGRITSTCDTCHKTFRVLPDAMDRAKQ